MQKKKDLLSIYYLPGAISAYLCVDASPYPQVSMPEESIENIYLYTESILIQALMCPVWTMSYCFAVYFF